MGESLERRSFLLLLIIVSIAFGVILEPFFGAIFWACAVTVIFAPLQHWLITKTGDRPNTAAALTLLVCMTIVVIPIIFLATAFIQEGVQFYQQVETGEIDLQQIMQQFREAFPWFDRILVELSIDTNSLRERISKSLLGTSQYLAKETLNIGQNTFSFLVGLSLMMYLTFFLLRDGSKLIKLIADALPLGDDREQALFQKFAEVTRATVKGNLVVAIVQGTLGGLIFWILGIPGPLLWGVVMSFLSLIPAVGAAIIWFPVSLYLFATGDWVSGAVLLAYGALVIGVADNVLRPILVGRDTKLPDYIVLFSTIGGISLFGINGFVIGPLIAALFMATWQIFMTDFSSKP